MKRRAKWIPKSVVLAIHERLLAEHGGAGGLVNEGLLDSALARPQNHLAYEDPDIFQLAAIQDVSPVRDNFINVHIALCARARLPYHERKFIIEFS